MLKQRARVTTHERSECVGARAAPAKGQVFVWDIDLPGFGVRTTPTGAKAWVVQFRVRGGKERRMVVGLCSKTPLEKARAAARTILSNADLGRDPAEEWRDARDLKPETNPLFAEFAERWMVEVAGRRNRIPPAGAALAVTRFE